MAMALENQNSAPGVWEHHADESGHVAQIFLGLLFVVWGPAVPVFAAWDSWPSEGVFSVKSLLFLPFSALSLYGVVIIFDAIQRIRGMWRIGSELDVASGVLQWWYRGKEIDSNKLDMQKVEKLQFDTDGEGERVINFHMLPSGVVDLPPKCLGDEKLFKSFVRRNFPKIKVVT